MKKYIMIIDVSKCHGCHNCFLACKDEHVGNTWAPVSMPQPRHEQRWRNILLNERGQYPLVDPVCMPTNCMMCENAPCVKAGNGAVYRRDDGLVLIDNEKAIGRKDLVGACPYHTIWWNDELQLPQKCTFCAHLLDEGWTETRCSQICPTGATKFMAVEEAELSSFIEQEGLERYKDEFGTKPMVFYKNLYRFTKCFISGSLIMDGECCEEAEITVFGEDGKIASRAVSNQYGDFYADKLEIGTYNVKISANGKTLSVEAVRVDPSVYLGELTFK